MVKYLIKKETLNGIGDKIRVLNGSEETITPIEMQTVLDNYNTDMIQVLATQDDLIAQIVAALESKTGTSGASKQ